MDGSEIYDGYIETTEWRADGSERSKSQSVMDLDGEILNSSATQKKRSGDLAGTSFTDYSNINVDGSEIYDGYIETREGEGDGSERWKSRWVMDHEGERRNSSAT